MTGCSGGGPHIRTLAIVVNECHAAGGLWTARQRLEIRRGDCPPVTVRTVEFDEPVADTIGLCELYGRTRDGVTALSVGAFQGIGISSDGRTVLFQVTDDFVVFPRPRGDVGEEGIFVLHVREGVPRRLGAQAREAPFVIRTTDLAPNFTVLGANGFQFSPDGTTAVFTDRGPGTDGSDAPQLFAIDTRTGERRQVTRFAASSLGESPRGTNLVGSFLDDRRIGGIAYDSAVGQRVFTIRRDGSDFEWITVPVPIPGATVLLDFALAGRPLDLFSAALDAITDHPHPGPVQEVFIRDKSGFVQLTQLGASDTTYQLLLHDRERVVFGSSGDPVRENPSGTCQIFSVDRFGGHLRQLTRFDPGVSSPPGCGGGSFLPGCTLFDATFGQDPVTRALVFDATCDPFGVRPQSQQLYAMRPNGSSVRQLTNYRGVAIDGDEVDVELPGPVASPGGVL